MHPDIIKFQIVVDALMDEIRDAVNAGLEVRLDSRPTERQSFADVDWRDDSSPRQFTFTLPSHADIKAALRKRRRRMARAAGPKKGATK